MRTFRQARARFVTRVHMRGKRSRTQRNVPARDARRNVRAHVYASCVRVCAWISTKMVFVIVSYLMKLCFKFHKDRSFGCGDIRKTILMCV